MFRKKYDVIVCGAGAAGSAAALAAARFGAHTALVEKQFIPGGLATSGLVNVFLPLCDGQGKQVLGGITEELLKASIKYGPEQLPEGWDGKNGQCEMSRYMLRFTPAAFTLALDELLEEAGVDLWYDTVVTGAVMNGSTVCGVEVFNKSGHGILNSSSAVIDATGDADVAKFAGAELAEGESLFSVWAAGTSLKNANDAVKYDDSEMICSYIRIGAHEDGSGHPEDEKKCTGISGRDVSENAVISRRYLRNFFNGKYRKGAVFFPTALPAMPQFRTTRRIVGERTITESDAGSIPEDSSMLMVPDWKVPGRLWPVYREVLIPRGIEGLIAAGRIISAEGEAWNALRVIPAAAATGECAGKLALNL